MKKLIFLLILCSIVSGCAGSQILNIPQNHTLKVPQNSIVLGKLAVEDIGGVFNNCTVTLALKGTREEFPIFIPEGQQKALAGGRLRTDFYFFAELPPGDYSFYQATVEHEEYEELKFYMLNANVTIPESSLVFIGNFMVTPIARTLSMLGPTVEISIDGKAKDVLREFLDRYPEYQNRKVKLNVMSRYELFKQGGIGGEF